MTLPPPTQDDAALVERAREGSREAFAELVRRHQGAVRAFVARLVHELDAADDLAQEAFLAAFQNLPGQENQSGFLPWVFAIARHKACSHLRERIRRRRHESALAAVAADEQCLARAEAATDDPALEDWLPRLAICLKRLAPRCRQLINEHYYRGETLEALAARSGKQGSAVRTALWRIRQALAKCLSESAGREGAST